MEDYVKIAHTPKKRFAQVIAVAWERDLDDNRHPLVIVQVCDHELRLYDHPTEGLQAVALAATRMNRPHAIGSAEGTELCEQALPRVLGAPIDWGKTGVALAHIANDLYEHGWRGAGELWQGKRVEIFLDAPGRGENDG